MASVLDSIDEFLSRCQQSGDDAYAALRSVLDRLDDPATRVRARVFLDDIKRRFPTKDDCDRCFSSYHFRIDDIFLDQYEGPTSFVFCCFGLYVCAYLNLKRCFVIRFSKSYGCTSSLCHCGNERIGMLPVSCTVFDFMN